MFFSFDLKNNVEIKIPSLSNFFILFADLNHDDVNTKIIMRNKTAFVSMTPTSPKRIEPASSNRVKK